MTDSHSPPQGMLLAFSGAFILSFDTLLLRLIDGAPLQVAFWRGLLMFASGLAVSWALRAAGWTRLPLAAGRIGLLVAACYGLASIAFVAAAMWTSIANMLTIVATAPLWAAAASTLFLKERTPLRTWAACAVALIGMLVVAWPGLSGSRHAGDAAALLAAWSMAGAFVASRRSSANLALAPATGGLLSAIVLLPFIGASPALATASKAALMGLEGALLMPAALGLIAMAPRHLPAAQVGLFLLLETFLGPLWIWLALDEQPTAHAIAGASIVMLALASNAATSLSRAARSARPTC